jgi:hypothetical protein
MIMNAIYIALLYLILFYAQQKMMLLNKCFSFQSCTLGGWIYDFHKTHVRILTHMDRLGQGLVIALPILILSIFQYFKHNMAIMFRVY